MAGIEQCDGSTVASFLQSDPHCAHEPCRRLPEFVSHNDQALDALAVTQLHGLHENRFLQLAIGMKPLFELIEYKKDFGIRLFCKPIFHLSQRVKQTETVGNRGSCTREAGRSELPRYGGLSPRRQLASRARRVWAGVPREPMRSCRPRWAREGQPRETPSRDLFLQFVSSRNESSGGKPL